MALQEVASARPCSPPVPWPPRAPRALQGPPCPLPHGTTTLAFRFHHGVVAAADSRASCGGYVASPNARKLHPVATHLVATASGTSADIGAWLRGLSCQLALRRHSDGREPRVAEAAAILAGTLWRRRGEGLSLGAALCGWDRGGPALWYVADDGTRLAMAAVAVGSGSPYAYGVLDGAYREDLALGPAVALARRAVAQAARRDAYSGGTVDVVHVGPCGWRWVVHADLAHLAWGPGMPEDQEEEEEEGTGDQSSGTGTSGM
ncbi:proteasome subunit beta type-11 [Alligator mississippiensis]|uniref:Proteasome subunit beta n=1 Tax=Alligator mississippiensis TaxID=8496 RepID=A0A151NQC6_ALLMI|nr:proteasome subunit beta type-11 [Alligator mississippiensis]KYO38920.1 proteasome subunit beta type-11 [Alligator mississippiensis]